MFARNQLQALLYFGRKIFEALLMYTKQLVQNNGNQKS